MANVTIKITLEQARLIAGLIPKGELLSQAAVEASLAYLAELNREIDLIDEAQSSVL